MKQWFALYVQPRKEKVVEKGLIKNNFECYLPLKREIHKWSDRRKLVLCPLIPSYIFVKVDSDEMYKTLQITGAVRFIYFNKKPAAIPDNQIEYMKKLIESDREITVSSMSFQKGDKVAIVDGKFKGMEGLIIQEKGKNKRFVIRIENIAMDLNIDISQDEMDNIKKI